MANKKTVVQMYEEILAIPALTAEQKAFIEKRIEITQKKNASGKNGELTPKQKEKLAEVEANKAQVLGAMEQNIQYTPTDLLKLVNSSAIPSTQKLTPLLTSLAEENKVVKTTVKGRTVYSLPLAEVDEE